MTNFTVKHPPAIELSAEIVRSRTGSSSIDIAVVLGSGWSLAATNLGSVSATIPYAELPAFVPSTVAGHAGSLSVVQFEGATIACFNGRTHLYEKKGHDATLAAVRLTHELGAPKLVLTNGCGSTRERLQPGTPVLISDHLNLTGSTPLVGPIFIDCSEVYSKSLRAELKTRHPDIAEGVYAQFRGPQYETPAEVNMAATLGADLVGMSTAFEAIEARRLGLEVLAVSLVTNLAAGVSPHPLDHKEVLEAGAAAAPKLAELLMDICRVASMNNRQS